MTRTRRGALSSARRRLATACRTELQGWRRSGSGDLENGRLVEGRPIDRQRFRDDNQSEEWIERDEEPLVNRGNSRRERRQKDGRETDDCDQPSCVQHASQYSTAFSLSGQGGGYTETSGACL